MREVTDHACALAAEGKDIVFTAAIVMDGKVVARARNEAADTNDVSRHAEVVAIAKATDALGKRDLTGATLVSSCQPCEMCLSTMRWARIARVVFAAQQANTAPAFFRFPKLTILDFHAACEGAFDWYGGLDEDRVHHIYGQKKRS
ncbi:cytidine/deoxycytidylate deaminase-like protein [Yoonia sediminilitoris]|uniref:Cytidine/deoxycytidylate deaminase-like protein n=2 Tax=Yoonia sediminilitoris TaxID=1286148 RepID=A0A2T6KH13_9RHOB|nr:nucleoside deaminase [Yoonia sediminilitoris]PUB14813.1 cytidine/deoxycytidylate deaminase-like protein [Yoonia sediminilitoris]RCW95530.1 cytidine/deoxycytidylate deaminase-like protein [Yoonia sediminilitoris]